MDTLFQKIVQTTKAKRAEPPEPVIEIVEETEQEMLERHCQELYELIIYNYEDNITAAASRGSTAAVLCLYNLTAMHRGIVPVHDLLLPSERIQTKLTEYNIVGLVARLQTKFNPFKISIKRLDELDAIKSDRPDINAILVEWDIEAPELVVTDLLV